MKTGFVCFGEINTPFERLRIKHDHAVAALGALETELLDAGIVIDDPTYEAADRAAAALKAGEFSALIVCLAGWVPTHAVMRVIDGFRRLPMVLWSMCGWMEDGHIVTTADQAGASALRPAMEAMDYTFKFVYSVMGEPEPIGEIDSYIRAADAAARLRNARIGSMGYRDMLLYGTQFEAASLRGQLGVEVETFEMLEMLRRMETLDPESVRGGVRFVRDNWKLQKECGDEVIEEGVRYALAVGAKIEERGYDAVSLIDVDGMKKLLGFPPAMVFMLLESWYGVETTPENDIMGNVTQLMLRYLTGQRAPYFEYYEFFKDSVLAGVPDYVPPSVVKGDVKLLPTAFGLLNASLLNVSEAQTGYVTCARLFYKKGRYSMHLYTGEAKKPPRWEEYGWAPPAPQLVSLEIFPDSCTVPEFAQKVSSQHVIVCYGDHAREVRELCALLDVAVI